jgi:hypothetical protein
MDESKMNFIAEGCEGVEWIHLALDVDQWRALDNDSNGPSDFLTS